MKNLFISFLATSVLCGVTLKSVGQTNVNLEKLNQKTVNQFSLKFIDAIELIPEGGTVSKDEIKENIVATNASAVSYSQASSAPSVIENCQPWQFKYAMMTDRDVEALTNNKLYSFIDEWWATRYRYGGQTKSGIDCSAFTGALLNQVYGINAPRTAHEQYAVSAKIMEMNLQEGDLVFFNTRGGISHVGVYLGNSYFVHSSVHDGVTISSLNDKYYYSKFIIGGRLSNSKSNELQTTVVPEEN